MSVSANFFCLTLASFGGLSRLRVFHLVLSLRTFALIVYAHSYCARKIKSQHHATSGRARAPRKKSILMKGWYALR